MLSTTARAKARAARKAKEVAAAGGEGGGEAAMDTDQPAAEGQKAEDGADKKEGEKATAEPEPSSFTGGCF